MNRRQKGRRAGDRFLDEADNSAQKGPSDLCDHFGHRHCANEAEESDAGDRVVWIEHEQTTENQRSLAEEAQVMV